MDNTGLEPANAESNASTGAPKVDSEGTEVEGADPATAAAETGKPAPRDKVQERFDTLTREKYEALSARDRERYQREALEARLAELERKAPEETVAPSDEFPTLESCGWDEAELRKQIDAYYDKKFDARAESALQKRERQKQEQQETVAHERRESEFIKSKPDYAEKVLREPRDGGPVITEQMGQVIRASDLGPEIAYYLAEHVEKSAEIARLPAYLQAAELGEIRAMVKAAKASPPPVSKAPPPVGKIEGTDATGDKDPSQMSDAEFEKWRKRQIAQRR